jgi:hypothetical protein
MKRIALLIGNSNGLEGVKKDINNHARFLSSDFGGAWHENEIAPIMNPDKKVLLTALEIVKNEKYDFSYVVFSGHGAYQRQTVLEINNKGEYIYESDLIGLSSRQLSIFDCCRNTIQEEIYKSNVLSVQNKLFSFDGNFVRQKYETRIMQAKEQQNVLYACSVNESALDTPDGGLYTKNLLSSITPYRNEEFKLVGAAHIEAKEKTQHEARLKYHNQTPEAYIERCLTSQSLIISINPHYSSL